MQALSHRIYRFDDFELDAFKRQLVRSGQPVTLQPKAFDLLLVLVDNGGRLLTKDDLLNLVWPDQIVEESNLTVHMSALRKALGEHRGQHRFVVTEPGRGYRFVADVSEAEVGTGAGDEEFSIESHTLSCIVIDGETETGDDSASDAATKALSLPATVVSHEAVRLAAGQTRGLTKSRRATALVLRAFAALTLLTLAFGLFRYLNRKASNPPFQQVKLSRLTNNGKVSGAAITPDGKYVAYVLAENEGNSLWVKQVGTASNIRILPPIKSEFWGVEFSPDGAYIYYNLFAGDKADVDIFRVPSLGGMAQKILNISAPAFTLSPDGRRIAYPVSHSAEGKTYLQVSDADGTNARDVAERQQPSNFEIQGPVISWSPDGATVACVVNHYGPEAHYSAIVGVGVNDGAQRSLSNERWYNVYSLQWLKDGSGLFVVASDKPTLPGQVWFLSYPSGGVRKITNDLSQYAWLGVASDGQTLVTVQTNSVNSLWLGKRDQVAGDFREIIAEIGPLTPLAWLSDGNIVFRSHADGNSNLWLMEADGSRRRQLTTDTQVSRRGLCASPDGKHLVFVSWHGGKQHLWRVDVDDGSLTQLTNGDGEGYPSCSPDGRWVVYQNGLGIGKPTLWRTSLSGSEQEQLVETFSSKPAISHDGERIAYFYMEDRRWRIGIIPSGGGKKLQSLDLPASVAERVMRWSPDGKALYYVSIVGDVGNVWSLPLDGKPPQALTNFTSHLLEDFTLSPDGQQVAFTRTTESRDVVLITGFR
ncbi:MAG: winged helix-turn-helix domain-containing protein [Pyrinomonadaceae bacterium]|nr:winged helix-turn-helix domain-containing protein [Pyrinomonadaceae bacterium]